MQRYVHKLFGWDYIGKKEQQQQARARQIKYETTELIKKSTLRLKPLVKVNQPSSLYLHSLSKSTTVRNRKLLPNRLPINIL